MLLQHFQAHLKKDFLFTQSAQKLLLAVSGGIDSVVITDVFFKSGFDFVIAHCNFQLREDESIRDELFVRELGKKYDKEVLVKRFDTKQFAEEKKISIQEAARDLRYTWFEETLNHNHQTLNFLATAHNADDNIETMLMFLCRGTGIHGLTGIKLLDKKRKIIRPLLFATRKEITTYAEENNLSWVEDSSNVLDKYTRNFFRLKIIPSIEKNFPQVKESLLENIKRFNEVEQLYTQAIEIHKKKLLLYKGNEIHIPVLKLQKTNPLDTVLWSIIKVYNFNSGQIDEVKKLFEAGNSSYVQSSSHRIIKNRNWLIIAQNTNEEASHILIEENTKEIFFRDRVLQFELLSSSNFKLQTLNSFAQLDAKHITFPLLLRKWKQGDYFYPLGMNKKKKLSRFFIDKKLSATEKENVWILEMNKKIIWIINYRIDDRFKITPATKEVLKIACTASLKR
ncbi:MAG: tRNA lysidine(34) synthetase TilS [Parafilimonas sp.]